jgi:hypothetical protein
VQTAAERLLREFRQRWEEETDEAAERRQSGVE